MEKPKISREKLKEIADVKNAISRCLKVIRDLEDNAGYKVACEDMKLVSADIDNSWAFVKDDEKLQQLRVAKMAAFQFVTVVDSYKTKAHELGAQLQSLQPKQEEADYGE